MSSAEQRISAVTTNFNFFHVLFPSWCPRGRGLAESPVPSFLHPLTLFIYHYCYYFMFLVILIRTFPLEFSGSLVIKNLPCILGDVGLIPCQSTKIPYTMEQLLCPCPLEPCHN